MADAFVFGTAAADILLRVPTLPTAGDQLNGVLGEWRTGGSSANLACGLASAGHTVRLVGPIGNDPVAVALAEDLAEHGVSTKYLAPTGAPSPRALIMVDDAGERTIIVLGRPDGDTRPAIDIDGIPDLAVADLVYIESSAKYPLPFRDLAPNALLAGPPPDPGVQPGPLDVVLASVSNLPVDWAADPYAAACAAVGEQLHWIVVSAGDQGATAYGPQGAVSVSAIPARQVDSTGAGDAFAAGVLHQLVSGAPIESALTLGTRWGAAAVESWSSIPPTLSNLIG